MGQKVSKTCKKRWTFARVCDIIFYYKWRFTKVEVYKFCPRSYVGSNSYLIVSGDEAAIVDPSVPYDSIASHLSGARLRYILLTHCHFDHILKVDEYVERTGAEVIVGELDRAGLSSPITNCYRYFMGSEDGYFGKAETVRDGERLPLGSGTIKVIATPGHTAGGVCYLADSDLFAGDTVFAGGGYGRCDLPGGDEATLFASISRLCSLPDEVAVYPGHGEDTDIKEIKRNFK